MNEISADYIKARELDRRIKTSAQLAQQSLYDMCMGFKEMRDSKLYREMGYQNFEDYCEKETGFSRMNVYNYISIAEKLPKDFVNSNLQIGVKKLTLLSKLSEDDRTEITENTDLESTSVKELEKQIKELKIKADKAEMLSNRLDDMNKICDTISGQRDKAERKIAKLEAEIKELESRPIDVAVVPDSKEIEKLKAELEQTKAEYEKRLAEKPQPAPADESKMKFKILLSAAYDALMRAAEFAESSEEQEFKAKLKQLISAVDNKLKESGKI